MEHKEVRLRCVEAVANMGVRSPDRILKDAMVLEEWVMAVADKEPTPVKARQKKVADKD